MSIGICHCFMKDNNFKNNEPEVSEPSAESDAQKGNKGSNTEYTGMGFTKDGTLENCMMHKDASKDQACTCSTRV